MKKEKLPPAPLDLVKRGDIFIPGPIATDPLGSYTGIAVNPYEPPVQDADDL